MIGTHAHKSTCLCLKYLPNGSEKQENMSEVKLANIQQVFSSHCKQIAENLFGFYKCILTPSQTLPPSPADKKSTNFLVGIRAHYPVFPNHNKEIAKKFSSLTLVLLLQWCVTSTVHAEFCKNEKSTYSDGIQSHAYLNGIYICILDDELLDFESFTEMSCLVDGSHSCCLVSVYVLTQVAPEISRTTRGYHNFGQHSCGWF